MHKNTQEIIDFIGKMSNETNSLFIEHGDKLLCDQDLNLDFYSFIITNYNKISDIHVEGESNFGIQRDARIRLRIDGQMKNIGTINKDGIASINDSSFPVLNEFENIYNFDYSDQIIKILYVPSKGLYRVRVSGLSNCWIARIICLLPFKNDKCNLETKNITSNVFDIHFLKERTKNKTIMIENNDDFSNINELRSLNSKNINKQIYSNTALLQAINELPQNNNFKFKLYPTLEFKDDEWQLHLIYKIYILTNSISELLSFVENNRDSINIPFFKNFYTVISNKLNKLYGITIDINENTDMNEIRSIIKTLEY